jgi:hypothetical protein
MIKILLCIEDHKNLNNMSLVFKKLGFDVETLSTEIGLQEKLLGFKADVVIASGVGKVTPISISTKLKEWGIFKRGVKLVILLNSKNKISPAELAKVRIDGFLESNSPMERVLEMLCKSANVDSIPIIEKFHRMIQTGQLILPEEKMNSEEPRSQGAKVIHMAASDHERVQKYSKFTQNLPKKSIESISRTEARKRAQEMSKDWDKDEIEFIDAEKREFVRALFKKQG